MARIGRLGCTITKQFVWGIEVTNTSGTFRGTVTTPKNNGIVIRINGDETRWPGTHKGAVRLLRKLAQRTHTTYRKRLNIDFIRTYELGALPYYENGQPVRDH